MDTQYAVVAFPDFENADSIEAVRRRFDPLAGLIAAHVTLIFPLSDDRAETHLADHVQRSVRDVSPFDITLTDISRETDGYLFLNVGVGAHRFRELHNKLYTDPWARHRSLAHEYRPHVTIGRIADRDVLAHAHREADLALTRPISGTVTGLAIFRLETPDRGTVIHRVAFPA